ncbi:MAG: thiamine-phosphate kinase [Verrucomicrobiota bacterium]
MNLRDLGEDEVIRRLVALMPLAEEPAACPGDDCAIMRVGSGMLLLKTDALVEGVHFRPAESPERIGWKAIARVTSDFAAMGGRPENFLITVAVDPSMAVSWLEGVYRGMAACMRKHGGLLAGGETSSVPAGNAAVISVAAVGSVKPEHMVLRSGGRPGDVLLVTGTLGGSIHGKHLDFVPRVEEAAWLVGHHKPGAMMDLSDGLGADLPRLAKASGCGYEVDRASLPVADGCDAAAAWSDGEDYELLFAIVADCVPELLEEWSVVFPELPLTVIGKLTDGSAENSAGGWDHFSLR